MTNEIKKANVSLFDSFMRIWPFLKNYKGRLFTALFLIFLQVVTNVLEPLIFGLIITEISANVIDVINNVPGAGLNYSYIYMMIVIYFGRGLLNQVSSFGSTYFMTETVQNMTFDLRNTVSNKRNRLPVS